MTEELESKFSNFLEPDAIQFSTVVGTNGAATTGMTVATKAAIIGVTASMVIVLVVVAVTTSAVLTTGICAIIYLKKKHVNFICE